MSQFSASAIKTSLATTGLALLLFAAAVPAQSTPAQTAPLQTPSENTVHVSKVRIVRVSEIRGAVELDRSNGHGYEPAIANLPVVEQNRLKTGVGVAEVEFEDNSTLRLGPNSEVEFTQLGRTSEGRTLSSVKLLKGIAYVSLLKPGGKLANQFDLAFGDRKIPLEPGAHVRLIMDEDEAKFTVLSGAMHLEAASDTVSSSAIEIPKKKTAIFDLTGQGNSPVVGKNQDSGPLDAWDKQNTQYHERVASNSAFGSVPYSYGLADMMYYGSFADMGGCGMMWRPYFTSAAWDPYSVGSWAWYSGAGYSWVSPYPWGWMPYHYGSWNYCPGSGWGWMPGGSWMGLDNMLPAVSKGRALIPKGGLRLPTAPTPPRPGQPTLLRLNQTPLVHSGIDQKNGAFVFRKDSAGLGIPRNELGNLRGFSQHAIQHGAVSTPIYASTGGNPSEGGPGIARGSGNVAPVMIHRGFAPVASEPSTGNASGNWGASSSTGSFSPRASTPMPVSRPSAPSSAPSGGGSHPH